MCDTRYCTSLTSPVILNGDLLCCCSCICVLTTETHRLQQQLFHPSAAAVARPTTELLQHFQESLWQASASRRYVLAWWCMSKKQESEYKMSSRDTSRNKKTRECIYLGRHTKAGKFNILGWLRSARWHLVLGLRGAAGGRAAVVVGRVPGNRARSTGGGRVGGRVIG